MKKILFLLFFTLLCLAACSSSKVTGVWQDEEYREAPFENILVVSFFLDGEVGRMSEVELARLLRKKGISASAGQIVLPAGSRSSVEKITEAIGNHAFDGILISRIVDKIEETRTTSKSACNSRWDSDYRQNQRYSLSPCQPNSMTTATAVFSLETKLYSAKDKTLVMSMNSASTADRPSDKLVKDFVGKVAKRLSNSGLLAKP